MSIGESSSAYAQQTNSLVKKKFKNFSDKYNKGKLIGQGPFGHVYSCWLRNESTQESAGVDADATEGQEAAPQQYALKVLKKNLLSQKPVLDDLLVNEFKVLMNTNHPNIIRMYDIFQDRQNFFIV